MEHRKRTMTLPVHDDVCFPVDALSEMGEEDAAVNEQARGGYHGRVPRRRRRKVWPELSVLQEWSLAEQEDRSDEVRAKKVSEPVFVHGRLRPLHQRAWHRSEEDAPYRFTYFNEDLPSTIHSQTISELLQPGQTFKDLFVPEPPVLSDSESDDDDDMLSSQETAVRPPRGRRRDAAYSTSTDNQRSPDQKVERPREAAGEDKDTGQKAGPAASASSEPKPKRYGSRPVFWLDVMSPTDAEIRVLAKTFGIHPLTVEDIMLQEAREKVELFHNYYFVNYRTFEQDPSSPRYMDPVSLFVVVFREGVLTVSTPHFLRVHRISVYVSYLPRNIPVLPCSSISAWYPIRPMCVGGFDSSRITSSPRATGSRMPLSMTLPTRLRR
jgi:magnesium transporter